MSDQTKQAVKEAYSQFDKAHYPSGEPGTTGREPFDESGDNVGAGPGGFESAGSGLKGSSGGAAHSGLATDSYGGTIARDTEVRGGDVVGLGTSKDSSSGLTGSGGVHSGSGAGAGLGGAGTGAGVGSGVGATGTGTGAGGHSSSRDYDNDRTGNLDQEAHKYESTGSRGPTTSGAAGTDRFDLPSGGAGAERGPSVPQDDSHRKGTGGIGGILGTTDKEFTANPSRTADGAYNDTHGKFQSNTSGPGGNTALTGREGTAENNPVAQAQSRAQESGATHGHGAGEESGEKKGLMDKVKDAFK